MRLRSSVVVLPCMENTAVQSQSLISVIIPTYNRAHIVGEAIDSVLGQTYPNVELIVVDDGSTDKTLDVLAGYGDRIKVVAQKNGGPAAARNRGLAEARGEFIAFQDSDDLWLPEKLERQLDLMNSAGESVPCCITNIAMRWSDKEITSFGVSWLNATVREGLWLNPAEVLATRFVLFNQAVMIRRRVLDHIGGFDESIRFQEDYELPLRLSLEGPWAFISDPLVIWRESKGGSVYKDSQRQEICSRECMVAVYEQHLARVAARGEASGLRELVEGELIRTRRGLKAARLRLDNRPAVAFAGKVLSKIEQYRSMMFRRSSRFPMMKIEEVVPSASRLDAVAAGMK